VRIERVGIDLFQSRLKNPEFRANPRCASHGGIHMQPQALPPANLSDGGQGIHGVGGGSADGGADKEWLPAGLPVLGNRFRQEIRLHGVFLVHLYFTEISAADSGDFDRLFDRRMSLRGGIGRKISMAAGFIGV